MSMIRGNENLRGADAQRSTKLKTLVHRWHEALAEIRDSRLSGDLRQRIDARRRDRRAPDRALGGQLVQAAGDNPDPELIRADPPASESDAPGRELLALPDERSQALAVLCDRLLQELDAAEVKAAEIRFVVRRDEHPNYSRLDPGSAVDHADGELVWELRRLLAWSGGAIADVARALDTRGADLDEIARELLRDEVATLDVDLATLNVHLADPVDWDSEFECLLAGEVAPLDDLAADEDDENDD
jgi:hypothetical protein